MEKPSLREILAIISAVEPLVKEAPKIHGIIHNRASAEINGVKGYLVWDYIVLNEITFDDLDGNILSFFTSPFDEETQKRWDELIAKYGTD